MTKWGEDRKKPSWERKKIYQEYIRSDAWAAKRDEYYRTHRYRCSICGATRNLHLHHLTYRNIGREKPGDLTYLCRTCHAEVHRHADPSVDWGGTYLKEVTNYVRRQYHLKTKGRSQRGAKSAPAGTPRAVKR